MHGNGMLNAAVLVWNVQNPCVSAFACLWHNQVSPGCCRSVNLVQQEGSAGKQVRRLLEP